MSLLENKTVMHLTAENNNRIFDSESSSTTQLNVWSGLQLRESPSTAYILHEVFPRSTKCEKNAFHAILIMKETETLNFHIVAA